MTYRGRRLAKADRLREWADKRDVKAEAARARADGISDMIPFGQPVLVGHHSEGRHRRDLGRIRSGYEAEMESRSKADEFRRRAESIEAAAGRAVYSDDPDAIAQLGARIAEREAVRDAMKVANGRARRGEDWTVGLAGELVREGGQALRFWPGGSDVPFPGLSNLSASIRRDRQRLAELEGRAG